VIAGMARCPQLSSVKDAEMNGYVVFILNRMQASPSITIAPWDGWRGHARNASRWAC
jgi:hypothetical protein